VSAPSDSVAARADDEDPFIGLVRLIGNRKTSASAGSSTLERQLRRRCLLLTLKESGNLFEQGNWRAAAVLVDKGAQLFTSADRARLNCDEVWQTVAVIKDRAEEMKEAERTNALDDKTRKERLMSLTELAGKAYQSVRGDKAESHKSDEQVLAELEILMDRRLTPGERNRAVRMNWQELTPQTMLRNLRLPPAGAVVPSPATNSVATIPRTK
jgi:hypothetical protein